MSDGVMIALIGLIGTIGGAIISAYASIKSSQNRGTTSKSPVKKTSSNNKLFSRKWLTGARTGLVLGIIVAILVIFLTTNINNIDLGSGLRIERSEATTGIGATRVFSHYPVGTVQYFDVNPDDSLQKVEAVCLGIFKRNLTPFFTPYDSSSLSSYYSAPLSVPGFCRIDFTVYDELGGGYMGISLWAEYVR
ncbi:MAG: hypothetical protein R3D55_07535 [Chloroflexota bacterium]